MWHHAFVLTSQNEELGIIQLCSTATNMATFGTCRRTQASGADAGNIKDEAWSAVVRAHVDVWVSAFIGKNAAENETRSAHVLRTHGNQHQARGMPVAWNCFLAWTAATYPNSCVFPHNAAGE